MQTSTEDAVVMNKTASPLPASKDKATDQLTMTINSLEDGKAEDIVTIDLEGKSSLGDYMIVASGRSHRHVSSIADKLAKQIREAGFGRPRVEGTDTNDWVLVDAGSIIVHIFRPEVREFYNIEKMWLAARPEDNSALDFEDEPSKD
ncbi:MAG: ribosome silencing factor [Rhizobiales bacterium]|nr:ribosome silencing factor [Hyphomicrobiales bacterium]